MPRLPHPISIEDVRVLECFEESQGCLHLVETYDTIGIISFNVYEMKMDYSV